MEEIRITILGRPFTVNRQYCQRKGSNKRYLTNEARSYGDSVGWQARSQFRGPILRDNLEVTYLYYFAENHKKIDHLNFNKILNDRLNQIVWQDDRQILVSHHYTLQDQSNPRIELRIKKVDLEQLRNIASNAL